MRYNQCSAKVHYSTILVEGGRTIQGESALTEVVWCVNLLFIVMFYGITVET